MDEDHRSAPASDPQLSSDVGVFDHALTIGFDRNRPIRRTTDAGMPTRIHLMYGQNPHGPNPTALVAANSVWLLHLSVVVEVT
jgi:hypothetical protein